jgi:hypothetical protein
MSQLEENKDFFIKSLEIISEQIIMIKNKIDDLQDKIDNIIDFINKENHTYEIDWNSIHLY